MGSTNYKLTDKQKSILNEFANNIVKEIKYEIYREEKTLDVYDTPDCTLDRNKFTAIISYIGDKLSHY